jgi:hypothetical protein
MARYEDTPDWANPKNNRPRRRLIFVLLGIGLAALVVGLVFYFTQIA